MLRLEFIYKSECLISVVDKMSSSHLTMEHPLCSTPSKLAVVKKSVADIKGLPSAVISFTIACQLKCCTQIVFMQ